HVMMTVTPRCTRRGGGMGRPPTFTCANLVQHGAGVRSELHNGTYSTLAGAGPTAVAFLVLGSMPISATPPTPPRLAVTTWPRALKSACTASGSVLGTGRLPRLARS